MVVPASVLIVLDVLIFLLFTSMVGWFCYIKYRKRKEMIDKLRNIKLNVKGNVVGVEYVDDTLFGTMPTLFHSILGRKVEKKHAYVVQLTEPQEDIKRRTMERMGVKFGQREYTEVSNYSSFRGSDKDGIVYVEIDQQQYKEFTEPFEVQLSICPLIDMPGASIGGSV